MGVAAGVAASVGVDVGIAVGVGIGVAVVTGLGVQVACGVGGAAVPSQLDVELASSFASRTAETYAGDRFAPVHHCGWGCVPDHIHT